MKFKLSFLLLFLSISICASSIYATTITSSPHKKVITNYITEISQLQKQIFTLAEKTTFSASENNITFNTDLDLINSKLDSIIASMTDYYNSLPPNSSEIRDIVLLFNATNFMQSALFELNQLNNTTATIEKMSILENYFSSRSAVTDTLELVAKLLPRE